MNRPRPTVPRPPAWAQRILKAPDKLQATMDWINRR